MGLALPNCAQLRTLGCVIPVAALTCGLSVATCGGVRLKPELGSQRDGPDRDAAPADGDGEDGDDFPELDFIERERRPPGIQDDSTLVPVFEYWNFILRQHTVHADRRGENEARQRLLFYAFRYEAAGSEAVGLFQHSPPMGDVRVSVHLGKPRADEGLLGIACYAYPAEVAGADPVFQFWNSRLQEHTYHMGEAEHPDENLTGGGPIFYAYGRVPDGMRLQQEAAEEAVPRLTPIFEFTDHVLGKKSFHAGAPLYGEEYGEGGIQFYAWNGRAPGTRAVGLYYDLSRRQYNLNMGAAGADEVFVATAFFAYEEQTGGARPIFRVRPGGDEGGFEYRTLENSTWADMIKLSLGAFDPPAAEFYAYARVPPGMAAEVPNCYPGDGPRLKPVYTFTNRDLVGRGGKLQTSATTHTGRPWKGEQWGHLAFWGLSHQAPGTVPIYSFQYDSGYKYVPAFSLHPNAGYRGGLSEYLRTYTLHAGGPWPRETETPGGVEFYAYPSPAPGTEPVSVHADAETGHPVYRVGRPGEENESIISIPNLREHNNGSNVVFYAFRRPPRNSTLKWARTSIEKTAMELFETRRYLMTWLNALIESLNKQESRILESKLKQVIMSGGGYALLFSPQFPVGIALHIVSTILSLGLSSRIFQRNSRIQVLLEQRLVAESYLSDKLRVEMEVTRARGAMIEEEWGVDNDTAMVIAAFSDEAEVGVAEQMSDALKFLLTVKKIRTLAKAPWQISRIRSIQLAQSTWAKMRKASTILRGIGINYSIMDLLVNFCIGDRKKREAIQIRNRVNESLFSLTNFIQARQDLHTLDAQFK